MLEEMGMVTSSPRPEPNYDPFPSGTSYRSMVIECNAEALERMRKRVDISALGGFTIYCDEPPSIGGDNSAPLPLYYFAASILF
jgi:hypothetical protein